MKIKFNKKTKIAIIFIVFIIICIFISKILNLIENSSQDEDTIFETEANTYNETFEDDMEDTQVDFNDEEQVLEKVTNTSTYFALKQCMHTFYNSERIKSNIGIIDNEAIQSLNINEENVANLVGSIEEPLFTIDEIFSQKIDSDKRFYVIYHRLETSSSTYKNSVIIIKIDRKNNIFSIYPNEFLVKNNLTNLKENEHINLSKTIENRAVNYYSNISITDLDITKELYERFRFDLTKDLDKLYIIIDEEYKNKRFENLEDFKKYIQENNEELVNDKIEKYKVNIYSNFTEYVGISNNRNYIFIFKNIMDYSCLLDNYTVGTPYYLQLYNSSLPQAQAKYCISRAIAAINDKNYKFVYEKIDISKKQSLGNFDDFVKYIQNIFYDETNYEIGDYEIIGENVCYEFIVTLDNKEEKQDLKRQIKIRIILQDNADFIMMIDEK